MTRTRRFSVSIVIVFVLLFALAACSARGGNEPQAGAETPVAGEAPTAEPTDVPEEPTAEPGQTPIVSHGGEVRDYVSLVDALRAAGATVEPGDSLSQPFFTVEGQIISVNGADVQVFEPAAAAAAETVSETGDSIGTSMVSWIDTPHIYHKGELIVIYVGSDQTMLNLLQSVLSEQIAGGPAPTE